MNGSNSNEDGRSVALYWDFENLHAGVMEAVFGEGAYGKQDNRAGGEDMMVLGTHLFDLMRAFAGQPESCFATLYQQRKRATRDQIKPGNEGLGPLLPLVVPAVLVGPGLGRRGRQDRWDVGQEAGPVGGHHGRRAQAEADHAHPGASGQCQDRKSVV